MLRNLLSLLVASCLLTGCNALSAYPPEPVSLPEPTPETIYMEDTPVPPQPTSFPQVFPELNPTLTAFSLRMQAVLLEDEDGSNAADVPAGRLMQWVEHANHVFAPAGIRIYFDPGTNLTRLASDALNNAAGPSDPLWGAAITEGNAYAAASGGRAVVFFRNTELPGEPGYEEMDFVFMPVSATSACGGEDLSLLAHQLGHYLGLGNTFSAVFPTLDAAAEVTTGFDGDGFADTLPDPYVGTPGEECPGDSAVSIAGVTYELPLGNIMAYYLPRDQLSPMQVDRARYMLALRTRTGSTLPSNSMAGSEAIEFEDLPLVTSWCAPQLHTASALGSTRWSRGAYGTIPTAYGAVCTYTITAPADGTYELWVYTANGPDRGTVQVLLDNWYIYESLDMYAGMEMPSGPVSLGRYYMEAGDHTLAFQVINKMLDSQNYFMGFDALVITPVE